MQILSYSLIIAVVFVLASDVIAVGCYAPNGVERNAQLNYTEGFWYSPCNNIGGASMCCAIGYGVKEEYLDVCQDGGYCFEQNKNIYWRESCTDPTWQDPACIKLFLNGTGYQNNDNITYVAPGIPQSDVQITPCDDGSFCYGRSSSDCCKGGIGVYVINSNQEAHNSSSTSSTGSSQGGISTTSSTATTSTKTPIVTTAPNHNNTSSGPPSNSSTDNTAASGTANQGYGPSPQVKTGIGAGFAAAILILLTIFGYLFYRERIKQVFGKKSSNNATAPLLPSQKPMPPPGKPLPTPPVTNIDFGSKSKSSSRTASKFMDSEKSETTTGRINSIAAAAAAAPPNNHQQQYQQLIMTDVPTLSKPKAKRHRKRITPSHPISTPLQTQVQRNTHNEIQPYPPPQEGQHPEDPNRTLSSAAIDPTSPSSIYTNLPARYPSLKTPSPPPPFQALPTIEPGRLSSSPEPVIHPTPQRHRTPKYEYDDYDRIERSDSQQDRIQVIKNSDPGSKTLDPL